MQRYFLFSVLILFLSAIQIAVAQTPPCSTSGHAGNSYDSCTGDNCERMVCNGSTYVPLNLWNKQGYGSNKFGPDASTCDSTRAGRMRYVSSDANPWQYCNGTAWTTFNIMGETSNLTCWGNGWYMPQNSVPARFTKIYTSQNILYGILSNNRMTTVVGGGSYPALTETASVKKVSVGRYFNSCTLLSTNAVRCYNGSQTEILTSWAAGVGTNAVDVATSLMNTWESRGHTCAVLSNGNLDCTSDNGDNENGVADDRTGVNAVKVAVGEDHTCILKSDNSVQCWNISSTPSVTDAIEIVAGGSADENNRASCLVRSTGAVNCWGSGPAVSGVGSAPSDAVAIRMSNNGETACAIRATGAVVCWGNMNENTGRTLAASNITTAKDVAIFASGSGCAITN